MKPDLAERLAPLAQMGAWDELKAVIAEKAAAQEEAWGRQVMAGSELVDVDYWRGFYAGARSVVNWPIKALKQLDDAVEQAAMEDK